MCCNWTEFGKDFNCISYSTLEGFNRKGKINPENGILLSPNYDALFDKHLISFTDDGALIISKSIEIEDLAKLGIETSVEITVNEEMKPFLQRHRRLLK